MSRRPTNMLPAGLRLLLRLHARGFLRKTWRGLRRPRTAILIVLTYGNILLVLVTLSLGRRLVDGQDSIYQFVTEENVAVGLSLFFAISMIGPLLDFPLVFQSVEIQFLYPAPLSRTSLRVYKLAGYSPMLAIGAAIGATLLEGGRAQFVLALPGMLLYLMFLLFSMVALGLLARLPRFRYLVLGAMASVAVAAGAELLPVARAGIELRDPQLQIDALRATYSVQALAAAGRPFAHTIVSGFDAQWLANLGLTAALTLGVFIAILKFDINFYELSLNAAAKREARLERFKRGKLGRGAWSGARRIRLRMLPRLGGAGPILYRHLLGAMREPLVLWFFVFLFTVPAGAGVYVRIAGVEVDSGDAGEGLAGAMYCAFILSHAFRFGFGGEYSVLDHLKVLPVDPFALAAGTIAVPAALALSIQILPLALFSLGSGVWFMSVTGLVFLVPCTIAWFALNNAFYLSAPAPVLRGLQANPTAIGRELLGYVGVGVILVLVAACAVGIFYLVRQAGGGVVLGRLAASAFLWPCAAGAVFLTGRAFRDLDLGRDRI